MHLTEENCSVFVPRFFSFFQELLIANYVDSKFLEIKWALVMYGESIYIKNISFNGAFTVVQAFLISLILLWSLLFSLTCNQIILFLKKKNKPWLPFSHTQTHKYTHYWKHKKETMWKITNIHVSFSYLLMYYDIYM